MLPQMYGQRFVHDHWMRTILFVPTYRLSSVSPDSNISLCLGRATLHTVGGSRVFEVGTLTALSRGQQQYIPATSEWKAHTLRP
jgi:hypothetical protein